MPVWRYLVTKREVWKLSSYKIGIRTAPFQRPLEHFIGRLYSEILAHGSRGC